MQELFAKTVKGYYFRKKFQRLIIEKVFHAQPFDT